MLVVWSITKVMSRYIYWLYRELFKTNLGEVGPRTLLLFYAIISYYFRYFTIFFHIIQLFNRICNYSWILHRIPEYRTVSPNIAPYPRISHHIPEYRAISPNIAPYPQISCHIPKYWAVSPNIVSYPQISRHIPEYRAISPDIPRYCALIKIILLFTLKWPKYVIILWILADLSQ